VQKPDPVKNYFAMNWFLGNYFVLPVTGSWLPGKGQPVT